MQVVVYSYHWESAEGELVFRWDNTPHFPNLPGFPHHVHDGSSGAVRPGVKLPPLPLAIVTISQTVR